MDKKRPPFIDIHKDLSNIFLTKGHPWDNKRFKSYQENRECLDFTEDWLRHQYNDVIVIIFRPISII